MSSITLLGDIMSYFFAHLSRLKLITRWPL
ncbi:5'-deoxynucleotidase, partial [Klebsiella pneumoniae]|nr:5'-deoxynucleotidase [Klebsiella pneumoniae]